ncbi:GrdX family protein [Clostridium sp. CM028]|uniref:GrdX family protein n=1 Tax=Clostridium TaxID=1485 RepID=UPI001651C4AE|nr:MULTISPECIES: GrdX family protein [Clostridium]MBU3093082.1 GrdX family protein [Clostridium sp. CF011]MBW9145811.1 GrdX family protein [Clostridium sp. CM027]MBW9149788.1 GrdX family protein [Clostridium sp. CM028]MBZ9607240.1 GrdX family protein [Clostridium estertheticum]UVE42125.1 GrdX family protein [Clostridium sp. CM027]
MIEEVLIVTNNPLCLDKFGEKYKVEFLSTGIMNVLKAVRNHIHKGHLLLTHPLSSSIKPNETPYKTVIITKSKKEVIDLQSVNFIEESIHTTEKFIKDRGTPAWSDAVRNDFMLIDYDIISHGLN